MDFNFDIWKYEYGFYKVYINRKSILNKIKKITSQDVSNIYYDKGKVIGWDILVPTKHISVVKKELKEYKKK